ncbi:MAG: hypothetical protein IJX98_04830 [Clostridia bacterium]|nr:hypothetical protein [Clostridia bacterium]
MKNALERVCDVIQSDKAALSEECQALIVKDFERKLSEYFDLSSAPQMQVTTDGGSYKVTISFEAERVKKFQVLK